MPGPDLVNPPGPVKTACDPTVPPVPVRLAHHSSSSGWLISIVPPLGPSTKPKPREVVGLMTSATLKVVVRRLPPPLTAAHFNVPPLRVMASGTKALGLL